MNIGIDVDGVLTLYKKFEIEKGREYFGKDPIDINTNKIEKMFNCSKKESDKFWIKYSREYLILQKARPFSAEIIQKLRDENNKIFIVTSRAKSADNDIIGLLSRKLLIYWLNRENISYDKIFFCKSSQEKREICEKNKIDIMIDDTSENIEEVSKVTKTYLFEDIIDELNDNSFLKLYNYINNIFEEHTNELLTYC